ncbi:DUF4167 domain-containing protein [Roseibium sp.]|uniref:DUF4167 domain-containing protein n=1 Tax=Roseibium sp. TaxID=1936156 RepID=UPI003A979E6B
MRPGNQSNKRMRGRGRKGPNPLSRTYESNGPDVKIRGTALHVAEKYQQLARDAQASGDRIMSENYFQHAEHYLRIVAAAQPQQQPAASQQAREGADESEADVAAQGGAQGGAAERRPRGEKTTRGGRDPVVGEDSPQPFIDDMPVIDEAGQLNGASAKSAEAAGEGDEDDAKPKRRVRGTRGKGVRKAPVDGDAVSEEAESAEATSDDDAEGPKPKRRVARTRRPKVTEETAEAEAVPAGE